MCRFVLYLGPEMALDMLTTRPSHSIIHQSFQSRMREEPLNGDGFGMAWYVPEVSAEPALFRSIQPAWNNVNLRHLARVCRSQVILAHVRAATGGSEVSEVNCHPFVSDRFAFMHNGSLGSFARHRRKLLQGLTNDSYESVRGTIDSEFLFARFRDHFERSQHHDRTQGMADALTATILEMEELNNETQREPTDEASSFLNLAVTDGTSAVVSRYSTGDRESPSLYTLSGGECACCDGIFRMSECEHQPSAVLVASEPLNEDSGWLRVPHNHVVAIRPDRSLDIRQIGTADRSIVS